VLQILSLQLQPDVWILYILRQLAPLLLGMSNFDYRPQQTSTQTTSKRWLQYCNQIIHKCSQQSVWIVTLLTLFATTSNVFYLVTISIRSLHHSSLLRNNKDIDLIKFAKKKNRNGNIILWTFSHFHRICDKCRNVLTHNLVFSAKKSPFQWNRT
jgi:hypothetical protein